VEGPLTPLHPALPRQSTPERRDQPGDDAGALVEVLRVPIAGQCLAFDGDGAAPTRHLDHGREQLVAESELAGFRRHPHLVDPHDVVVTQLRDDVGDDHVVDRADEDVTVDAAGRPVLTDQWMFDEPPIAAALTDEGRARLALELTKLRGVAGVGSAHERVDHVDPS
jgi:hypothetical protein